MRDSLYFVFLTPPLTVVANICCNTQRRACCFDCLLSEAKAPQSFVNKSCARWLFYLSKNIVSSGVGERNVLMFHFFIIMNGNCLKHKPCSVRSINSTILCLWIFMVKNLCYHCVQRLFLCTFHMLPFD